MTFLGEDYQKVRKIGRGSFGSVYLVYMKTLQIHCAMKVIDKRVLTRENKEHHAYIEKTILNKMSHPNIIQMLKCF
jgi:serine/threonine protein kinase